MSLTIAKEKLQRVKDIRAAGEKEIEAIDRDLRVEARNQRIAAIREKRRAEIEPIIGDMMKAASAAAAQLSYYTQSGFRRRMFEKLDASERTALLEAHKLMSTGELVECAEDAVREKNLAKLEAVRMVLQNRTDRTNEQASQLNQCLDGLREPQIETMHAECKLTVGHANYAHAVLKEFVTGRPQPVEIMTAAREAGLVAPPPTPTDPVERAAGLAA
jgi:hypothetical protein